MSILTSPDVRARSQLRIYNAAMDHVETSPSLPRTSSPDSPMRILIVDDHPAFRLGLIVSLRKTEGIEVCGEAGDAQSALRALRRLKPDGVILDISLPGIDGLELTKMIRAEDPRTAVVVFSMHDESLYAIRSLRAGASGYLRKDAPIAELVEALKAARRKGLYLSKSFSNQIISESIFGTASKVPTGLNSLSAREMEVFKWLGKGLGTRKIAEKLGLSIKTVEAHRSHLKEKLGVNSQDIIQLAREWSESNTVVMNGTGGTEQSRT